VSECVCVYVCVLFVCVIPQVCVIVLDKSKEKMKRVKEVRMARWMRKPHTHTHTHTHLVDVAHNGENC
jgi:hypothetical protein